MSISVLLVDDNAKYLKDALPFYGYEVQTAENGLEALEILKKNQFDIILLDAMMPKMNGWEALKEIRKTIQTPIIMITAVNDEQKMVWGLKNGADDYIVKPFILPNLLARMESVLRRTGVGISDDLGKSKQSKKTNPLDSLTEREREILDLVAQGASNKEIADKLVVKEVTIKTHVNSIFKKLNVKNRTQATLLIVNN